jgi:DNA-binding transcriptional LysR family regulator
MASTRLAGIDLNLLVALDVILAERNVTRAAARLSMSQPALSNALARLREGLGDPLLVRTPRGMTPTPRALALEHELRDALERVRAVVADASGFDPATARRTFVLAATDYVQFVLLGPLIERIQREAPGVVLVVEPMTNTSPWQELEAGTIDLTITGATTRQARLHRRTLFRDRVVFIIRADHPSAGRPWNLDRYLEHSHIEALPLGRRGLADDVLDQLGHARHIAVTVPHFLVAPFLVVHSDHCFTLAERIARPMAEILPLRVLPLPMETPPVTIWAYWHARLHRDPGHQWMRRLVVEVADAVDREPRAPVGKPKRPAKKRG